MSTTDGLYLLVEGELTKVTEDRLADWLAGEGSSVAVVASRKERFEARAILGVMNRAIESIRVREIAREAAL